MDEPTNGELARGIGDLKAMVGALVSRAEYTVWQDNVVYRLAELARDLDEERRARIDAIEQERRERAEAMKAVNDRFDAQAKAVGESRTRWHDRLWQGALPALVALIGVLVTIILSHHGGH